MRKGVYVIRIEYGHLFYILYLFIICRARAMRQIDIILWIRKRCKVNVRINATMHTLRPNKEWDIESNMTDFLGRIFVYVHVYVYDLIDFIDTSSYELKHSEFYGIRFPCNSESQLDGCLGETILSLCLFTDLFNRWSSVAFSQIYRSLHASTLKYHLCDRIGDIRSILKSQRTNISISTYYISHSLHLPVPVFSELFSFPLKNIQINTNLG